MRLDSEVRPAADPDSLVFFLDEPTRPYKAIGLVEVSDQGWGLSLDALKKKLGVEAGKLGAHGVIIGRESTQAGAVFVPVGATFFAASVDEKKLVGKLVVFLPRQP
jgi:hypothetical protein